jgi:hypothetical protein
MYEFALCTFKLWVKPANPIVENANWSDGSIPEVGCPETLKTEE